MGLFFNKADSESRDARFSVAKVFKNIFTVKVSKRLFLKIKIFAGVSFCKVREFLVQTEHTTIWSMKELYLEWTNSVMKISQKLNPIQDGDFRSCSRISRGGQKKQPLPKISHTNSTRMKLGTVTPYLKKIQEIYESYDTPPEF